MTMHKTTVRDLIARAAYGGIEAYYSQPNDGMQESEHDLVADAVLAVLADLPADVIERAARALFLEDANVSYVEWPEWDSAENLGKQLYIENAAAAFAAVFGGEQDD